MRVPSFPVYLFDIDGTLLDSASDICGAVREVLVRNERDGVSEEYLRSYIGRHLLDLFADLFPERTTEQFDAMIQDYRAIYLGRGHLCTQPYPGVAETLAQLGGRKSTATTKGTPTSRAVLEQFGLLRHFEHVQGTDGFPAKPAPDVILKSLEALGARPEDCLFIGDSAPDMEAGRRAGVRICGVAYGYGNHADMRRWEPDYWITDPLELL